MSVVRFLNGALLLGLGASLAISASRLSSHAEPDKAPHVVAPVLEPPPQPPPVVQPAWQPLAARDPASWACYQRVRRTHPAIFVGAAVSLHLNIGISGRVKHIGVTPPTPKLRPLLPCIREDVAKWRFPPNEEEYGVDINVSLPTWR